ncbi:hypothetical protein EJB05_13697, partial [Eragrostis curvula]
MARTDPIAVAIRAFVWLLVAVAASGLLFSTKASALLDNGRRLDPSAFSPGRVVAIDLGNTNSCVAGYASGDADAMFCICIPSWVALSDDGTLLVGEDAKNYAAVHPGAAVYGFKRLFGKRLNYAFEREFARRASENLPYKVLEKDGRSHVQVKTHDDGAAKQLGVEQLTLAVFAKLKETAEVRLGHTVHAAVVTLPQDCHNDACQDAPLFAATFAGFDAVRVLHEPVTAAVAYGLSGKLREEGNVVVLHLGGGTAEATVMTFVDGVYEVLGQNYDPFFGGEDFDRRTVEHFVQLIKDKYGKDVSNDSAALQKLRSACEHAKKTLSHRDRAEVHVDSLVEGLNLSESLTRAKFEELNRDLFLRVVEMVDTAVSRAEIAKYGDVIDEVVLVGGSTVIPKVRELVKGYFAGKEIHTRLKPDEVVTVGAVLYIKQSCSRRQR